MFTVCESVSEISQSLNWLNNDKGDHECRYWTPACHGLWKQLQYVIVFSGCWHQLLWKSCPVLYRCLLSDILFVHFSAQVIVSAVQLLQGILHTMVLSKFLHVLTQELHVTLEFHVQESCALVQPSTTFLSFWNLGMVHMDHLTMTNISQLNCSLILEFYSFVQNLQGKKTRNCVVPEATPTFSWSKLPPHSFFILALLPPDASMPSIILS